MEIKVVVVERESSKETNTKDVITDSPIEYLHQKRKENKNISYEGLSITIGQRIPNYSHINIDVFSTNSLTDEELEKIMKAIKTMNESVSEIYKKRLNKFNLLK